MTFYFYDLETSGFDPRRARIMQFAGQRTDMDLKPVGDPDNILIKMTPDVLPEPDAVLVHGVTPQQTLTDGLSEVEFVKYLNKDVFKPDTIFVGYNNIRFDDEFMRFTLWRNFNDSYEWQWKDGRSRWDMLDVARMIRALRPEGIEWPFASDGSPSNRLELLASVNKLDHESAHDALSDVQATIALAQLFKDKQPKIFDYLLNIRDKNKVTALVNSGQSFVYTSGRYPGDYEKTTVVIKVGENSTKNNALVYDLRIDPTPFLKMNIEKLAELWGLRGREAPYFPVKQLSYNKAPAIAPVSVLDKKTQDRLKIDMQEIEKNRKTLLADKDFGTNLAAALDINMPGKQAALTVDPQKVDEQLYDGFVSSEDKTKMSAVRAADAHALAKLHLDFKDMRLKELLPLYKARNFSTVITDEEQEAWEKFKVTRLLSGGEASAAAKYFKRIGELGSNGALDEQTRYLLEELNLYGQSVVPLE